MVELFVEPATFLDELIREEWDINVSQILQKNTPLVLNSKFLSPRPAVLPKLEGAIYRYILPVANLILLD